MSRVWARTRRCWPAPAPRWPSSSGWRPGWTPPSTCPAGADGGTRTRTWARRRRPRPLGGRAAARHGSLGLARAVCFPANEPGADGQSSRGECRGARGGGRPPGPSCPFLPLDPRRPWAEGLPEGPAAGGARGLKLHPVAQRFAPESPDAVALVAAAAERGWPVLIHAGYGARPLAGPLAALAEAVPGARLILAHGGRGDARAVRAPRWPGGRGLLDPPWPRCPTSWRCRPGPVPRLRTGPTESTAPPCPWWPRPRGSPAGRRARRAG